MLQRTALAPSSQLVNKSMLLGHLCHCELGPGGSRPAISSDGALQLKSLYGSPGQIRWSVNCDFCEKQVGIDLTKITVPSCKSMVCHKTNGPFARESVEKEKKMEEKYQYFVGNFLLYPIL